MKKALIVSYNLVREGEGETPLSIGSILSYVKSDPEYGFKFEVEHLPFNLLDNKKNLNDFETCFRNVSL
ncbi:MAG TPA: hypothetical protein VNX68_10825, partial [Nitrosopumilaceae archaeon]|nr:hypothetical protein [Nitrosopumilaceae archaeon]